MRILAIDPGPEESAYVVYETMDKSLVRWAKVPNWQLRHMLRDTDSHFTDCSRCIIEMIASYGMAVGQSTFETCVWVGRFQEKWDSDWRNANQAERITRGDVKLHLCHSMKAKDSNVMAAICDRYGGDLKTAKGTKKDPGPLYGLAGDGWAALGVAITAAESGQK